MLALILITTAYAPLALLQGWLADGRPGQPGDPGPRSRPPGLPRRRHLGDTWPGIVAAGRAARPCSAPSPCAECAAPQCDAERRSRRAVDATIAERVLRQNWLEGERDGVRFAYTQPSPGRYPWQWYWDSCFAAIVWRRFDPARARGRAGEPARRPARGRLHRPHDLLGPQGLADPAALLQRRSPAAPSRPRRSSRRCSPGPGGSRSATRPRSRGSPPRWTGWRPTATSRATGCSGSSSPTSRASTPRPSSTRSGAGGRTRGSASRCWSAATAGSASTPAAIRERGGPVLCEVVVNTLWSLSLQALGRPSATPALVERLWDERLGAFLDEAQPGGARPRVLTCAALAPLALPDLPEEIGRRLVEEHLLEPERVPDPGRAALGRRLASPPTNPDGGRGPIRRYWRGPTWVNTAWLAWIGLRRLGYEEAARATGGRPDRRGRARRPARVLRPARRHRHGRQGLRLVGADRRDGRP